MEIEEELKYLEDLIEFIGNGIRPIKAARVFYPDKPKGFINRTKMLRAYAWNRITAIKHPEVADGYTAITQSIAERMSYADRLIVAWRD